MQLDAKKITEIIETVREGVEGSWVGNIAEYGGTPDRPQKQVNQVAYALYVAVLGKIIDKMEQIEIVPSAPTSSLDISNFIEDS